MRACEEGVQSLRWRGNATWTPPQPSPLPMPVPERRGYDDVEQLRSRVHPAPRRRVSRRRQVRAALLLLGAVAAAVVVVVAASNVGAARAGVAVARAKGRACALGAAGGARALGFADGSWAMQPKVLATWGTLLVREPACGSRAAHSRLLAASVAVTHQPIPPLPLRLRRNLTGTQALCAQRALDGSDACGGS